MNKKIILIILAAILVIGIAYIYLGEDDPDEVHEFDPVDDEENGEEFELSINLDPEYTEPEVTTDPEPGKHTYTAGENITVEINFIEPEVWEFDTWTGDIPEGQENEEQLSLKMTEDREITAHFTEEIMEQEYELEIDSTEGGEVTEPGEDTYTHFSWEEIDLNAEPEEGYMFTGWAGDTETIENPESEQTSIEIQEDHSITANFVIEDDEDEEDEEEEQEEDEENDEEPEDDEEEEEEDEIITYQITLGSNTGGEVVEPGEGTFTYEEAETIELIAEKDDPDTYSFAAWVGDTDTIEDTSSPETEMEVEYDYEITAIFELEEDPEDEEET